MLGLQLLYSHVQHVDVHNLLVPFFWHITDWQIHINDFIVYTVYCSGSIDGCACVTDFLYFFENSFVFCLYILYICLSAPCEMLKQLQIYYEK